MSPPEIWTRARPARCWRSCASVCASTARPLSWSPTIPPRPRTRTGWCSSPTAGWWTSCARPPPTTYWTSSSTWTRCAPERRRALLAGLAGRRALGAGHRVELAVRVVGRADRHVRGQLLAVVELERQLHGHVIGQIRWQATDLEVPPGSRREQDERAARHGDGELRRARRRGLDRPADQYDL